MVTVGAVLPTVTITLAAAVRPAGSVTVSVTLRCPLVAKVWVGLAAVDVPPSPKFQAKVSAPPSGSEDPAEEKLTLSGAAPEVRLALARASGAWFPPGLYSIR